MQDFRTRFNNVYNSILNDMKSPPGLSLLHYSDAFDQDMAYQLRERDLATLEEMKRNVVSVEANLLNNKSKLKLEKKFTIKEESSSSYDGKLDTLIKTIEIMMERMNIAD